MVRPRRIQIENGYYHLYNRFIDGKDYFKDEETVIKFLSLFKTFADKMGIELIVYCIMINHFHTLIKTMSENLSEFLQIFGTNFARYVNNKYSRKGPVWQHRHQTKLIDEEQYFLHCSGYILNNSKAAGLVEKCEDYIWSTAYEIKHNIVGYSNPEFLLQNFTDKDDFFQWLNSFDIKKGQEMFDNNKTQFVMKDEFKRTILDKINRRKYQHLVKFERRRNALDFISSDWKEGLSIINRYKEEINVPFSMNKDYGILHLKWYFLRIYSGFSYDRIRILFRKKKHTTISSAIQRIEKNKQKKEYIEDFLVSKGLVKKQMRKCVNPAPYAIC